MATSDLLKEILIEKQSKASKSKVITTFRCSPKTWAKLQAIQKVYDLKMNDTLEAIIEFAYQNL